MIVGIDEVGRGCWAGPLVAGAVALQADIVGLADSKILRPQIRRSLASQIKECAVAYGLGWVGNDEIDEVGLTRAVSLAMQRALDMITCPYDEVIIDGNINYLPDADNVSVLVKADALVPAVSAASILAKVARDEWMATEGHALFPVYGFDKHVGYGTKLHRDMLQRHGACDLHRRSYKPVAALGAQP